jgi:hypothetical protein
MSAQTDLYDGTIICYYRKCGHEEVNKEWLEGKARELDEIIKVLGKYKTG